MLRAMWRRRHLVPIVAALGASACGHASRSTGRADAAPDGEAAAADADADAAEPDAGASSSPRILSTFFGLDDALPMRAAVICRGAPGLDGIPVTFSARVLGDPDPSAFTLRTRSGVPHTPMCATLLPADEPTERHTVLLVGEFGDEPADPPDALEVTGALPLDGADGVGLTSGVTPLAAGPSLVLALVQDPASVAHECPAGTARIVQITWEGGVTASDGGELGDPARVATHVRLDREDGAEVVPLALSDLGDNDNYVQLCLAETDAPLEVRVDAGVAFDPRGDPNPATRVPVR